ncbi:MAG TPA: hypothetical protein VF516_26410 [Kofleriaceae bacterium]
MELGSRGRELELGLDQVALGGRVIDGVDLGIAGYALWEVSDDRGPDLLASWYLRCGRG